MKKKFILVLVLLFIFVIHVYASTITEYTKSSTSQNFTLMLNKSGVNKIYFAEDASKTPLVNNRHIFPVLGENSNGSKATLITDNLYFFWELDDASGAVINLKFVSSDSEYNTGFMLEDVSSTAGLDFNYFVSVYEQDTTTNQIGYIVVEHGTVLTQLNLSQRTINVYSKGKSNNSYVKINMEVLAPIWEEGGTPAFMDAQYAGYIVAELKFN